MKKIFMYLTVILDVNSRHIVGWRLSNTLDTENVTTLLKHSLSEYGKPEIVNSDQGVQFTSKEWVTLLKQTHIKISMDGKDRA